jgi:hypothetical protein
MVPKVNGHIHTPYSFSAFSSIEQAVAAAKKEDIKVLGINDFNTADGYDEFYNACMKEKIYPLFNIEFMGLINEYQKKNIRVNDPNNPGRIYLSGKGFRYPLRLKQLLFDKIVKLQKESNEQTRQMIEKANIYFAANNIPIKLDFDDVKKKYAKELVRERHIAKAIRTEISERFENNNDKKEFLKQLYNGKESLVSPENTAGLEDEIRNNLLKLGGQAYIPENENAFLNINELTEIISDGGGIPCYPVLLDDIKGNMTDFESDWENMHKELSGLNIGCIELIPPRNSREMLEKFAKYFHEKKYIIIFGTEHNSPEMTPLTVSYRNNIPLSEELLNISFEGACVIAAHQDMNKFKVQNLKFKVSNYGFLDENNVPKRGYIKELAEAGVKVINNVLI